MTAEITIMNKAAIALAADSAVTLQQRKGHKIFNTANKLFTLSKYQPVGIMVYGNAEFMEIPWESIVKIYRKKLGRKKFRKLGDYANHFIGFLDRQNSLIPESAQARHLTGAAIAYFTRLREEIDSAVKSLIHKNGAVSTQQVRQIVATTIRNHVQDWRKYKFLPSLPRSHGQRVTRKYAPLLLNVRRNVFQKLPFSATDLQYLEEIVAGICSRDRFRDNASGVVIAGFGEQDTFPSIKCYSLEAVFLDRLKYKQDKEKSNAITVDNTAAIIPFAQSEMVSTFMEGVDPEYDTSLDSCMRELFDKFPDIFVQKLTMLTQPDKDSVAKDLKNAGQVLYKSLHDQLAKYRTTIHVLPVLNAVAALPKDELAAVAESLVNLTSFKRRISLDAETVGGPIDVAVISKGDGFIWIKRKHYFCKELNQHFLSNYFN